MDAALQELGSGTEPDDRPLWGKAYPVSVKKEKPGHQEASLGALYTDLKSEENFFRSL